MYTWSFYITYMYILSPESIAFRLSTLGTGDVGEEWKWKEVVDFRYTMVQVLIFEQARAATHPARFDSLSKVWFSIFFRLSGCKHRTIKPERHDWRDENPTLGYVAPQVLNGSAYNRKCDENNFGIVYTTVTCLILILAFLK
ncbi:hypothetical protein Tco_0298465 [Tanacetum coccineum]